MTNSSNCSPTFVIDVGTPPSVAGGAIGTARPGSASSRHSKHGGGDGNQPRKKSSSHSHSGNGPGHSFSYFDIPSNSLGNDMATKLSISPTQISAEETIAPRSRPVRSPRGVSPSSLIQGEFHARDESSRMYTSSASLPAPLSQKDTSRKRTYSPSSPLAFSVSGGQMHASQRTQTPLTLGSRSEISMPLPDVFRQFSPIRSHTSPNYAGVADALPNFGMLYSAQLAELIEKDVSSRPLIFDVRSYRVFLGGKVKGAVNVCVPTTLLKRPHFSILSMAEVADCDESRRKILQWKKYDTIIIYDQDSLIPTSNFPIVCLAKKFFADDANWNGKIYALQG